MRSRLKRFLQRQLLSAGGYRGAGRLLTWAAAAMQPPYKSREALAFLSTRGYVSNNAEISHDDLVMGQHVFVGDRVAIYQVGRGTNVDAKGGSVRLGDRVALYSDIQIETSHSGQVSLGERTHVQPRCNFNGVVGSVHIGRKVEIASNCAFYPYNHGMEGRLPIMDQPCFSSGDIVVEDEVWFGCGVIVLENVRIGKGAVIGAGSVVTRDVPEYAVAMGVPARVVSSRC